jgi:DNA helicase-2/ATP-dependent DNA helicase PcrA
MSIEYRIFGPPGTGKTTWLSRQIEAAVEKHGSEAVIVASFTRAAAAELVSRHLPVNRSQVGTLHAHCYRALGQPKIAETHIKEWNQEFPQYALSGEGASVDEPTSELSMMTDGDDLMSRYQILRAQMVSDRDLWSVAVRAFASKWEIWKYHNDLMDFTDMIEHGLRDFDRAPGNPTIGFFDECQDFVKLELALVRKWAESMEYVLLAGDEDQTIYNFKGATPEAFLDPPIPDSQKRVLSQSYRLPQKIKIMADEWIQQVGRREPKNYAARDEEGEIRRLDVGFNEAERIIDDMQQYLEAGKTIMLLTSCGYMLVPLIMELREQGIPFWNPYRRTRGDWNPLRTSRGISSSDRLLAYLRPEIDVWGVDDARIWNSRDLADWVEIIRADGILKRGAKKQIDELGKLDPPAPLSAEAYLNYFEETALSKAWNCDLDWLQQNLLVGRSKALQFPIAVAKHQGAKVLMAKPKIIVGTVHSVKGGEADVVYLSPNLSPSGAREMDQDKDPTVRQFYVGISRAKESLIIAAPSPGFSIELPGGK